MYYVQFNRAFPVNIAWHLIETYIKLLFWSRPNSLHKWLQLDVYGRDCYPTSQFTTVKDFFMTLKHRVQNMRMGVWLYTAH